MDKIGIFGGAFNPLHIGHLINAQFVLNEFSLTKIIFVPTHIPPHKDIADSIPAKLRLKMLRKGIKKNKNFFLSRIEIENNNTSYTINTLKFLSHKYNTSKLYLIIGNEWLNKFNTWFKYEEIFKYATLIVLRRDEKIEENIPIFLKKFSDKIFFSRNPVIKISSTYIRELIKKDMDVKYMLPESILKIIKKYNLYKGVKL